MPRSRTSHLWAIAWAVLQLLLPPLASIADAALERAGEAARVAHVEAVGDRDCPQAHGAECLVCRHIGDGGIAATAPQPSCVPAARAAHPGEPARAALRDWPAAARPRAPPVPG